MKRLEKGVLGPHSSQVPKQSADWDAASQMMVTPKGPC